MRDEKQGNISSTIKVESSQNFNLNPFDPNKGKQNPLSQIKSSMFESAI